MLAAVLLVVGPLWPALRAPSTQQAAESEAEEFALVKEGWLPGRTVHRARFESIDDPRLLALRARGAVRWEHDYGGFALVGIDESLGGGSAALSVSGLEWHDEQDLIPLNGIALDTAHPAETLAGFAPGETIGDPLDGNLDPDAGLYVLQFRSPPEDERLGELSDAGVTFVQYVPMNAYVVRIEPRDVGMAQALATASADIQYLGVFEPPFRMQPEIRQLARSASGPVPVTVQLVEGPHAASAQLDLARLSARVLVTGKVGPYLNVRCDLDPAYFGWLAAHPAVFAIETRGVLKSCDESQAQTMAGNIGPDHKPSAPGYLTWLGTKGFGASQFSTFSINVAGEATSLGGHPDLPLSRILFTQNPSGQSTATMSGHDFMCAQIIAGFNSTSGSPYEATISSTDNGLYHRGLGIAPWARVGSTAIFGPDPYNTDDYEGDAYAFGARISSNSWSHVDGTPSNPVPRARYDANAQEFDTIVRDARDSTLGNQQYVVVFAAGNFGQMPPSFPALNTISSPATAKNVITVGASENYRKTGADGCGWANEVANSIKDLAPFSSRGPVNSAGGDGRLKPEIVAPGTHVQGGVPQSLNYNPGTALCNKYYPSPGQELYSWSSGTSFSCPAVAGACALVRQWFLNHNAAAPSPAMTKAVLVAGAEYLTGVNANDTLPSSGQGFGRLSLARPFDGVGRVHVDQTQLLTATGQVYNALPSSFFSWFEVADTTKPVRVALVWTDAPGALTGAPYVNNLDLEVTVAATAYKGNVFAGPKSVTGGVADFRNNTEAVFLPAGTSGRVTVKVKATAIVGDGVPNNGDLTDQDFALVIYNIRYRSWIVFTGVGTAIPAAAGLTPP